MRYITYYVLMHHFNATNNAGGQWSEGSQCFKREDVLAAKCRHVGPTDVYTCPAYLEKNIPKNRVPQFIQPPCLSTNPLIFGFFGVRKKEGPKKTSFNLGVSQRTQCHTGPGAARRCSVSPYRKIHDLIGVSYQYNPWNIQKNRYFSDRIVEYVHLYTKENHVSNHSPWERT